MGAMYHRVRRHDVFAWGNRFLESLREAASQQAGRAAERPQLLKVDELASAYARANRRRLLLLDYDGTLVGFARRPSEAVPPPRVIESLSALASDDANVVAIVSGRSSRDLDRWFGSIPRLWLAAEHGAMIRSPDLPARWDAPRNGTSPTWKQRVLGILDHFTDRTPGSFIEEKEHALVWHYRGVHPEFGDWIANELVSTLEPALADTELIAQRGNKIVEVKPGWANKGEVLARLQHACPDPDFLLFAGDDRTDEDLFMRLPATAWSFHVGETPSAARYRLPDPARVQELLHRLAGEAGSASAAGLAHAAGS
jgi:trehalose 6-phosphate synthase/phosphatase